MCTREELNNLVRELLHFVDQVALLSAKIQFNQELNSFKTVGYLSCSEKSNDEIAKSMSRTRLKTLERFHTVYMRYMVFAMDPFADILVHVSSSSLALFITNITSKMVAHQQQKKTMHSSRTIVEFLLVKIRPAPLKQ